MSTNHDARNPVEALAEEFLARKRQGEPVTPEGYAFDHPELESALRFLLGR